MIKKYGSDFGEKITAVGESRDGSPGKIKEYMHLSWPYRPKTTVFPHLPCVKNTILNNPPTGTRNWDLKQFLNSTK